MKNAKSTLKTIVGNGNNKQFKHNRRKEMSGFNIPTPIKIILFPLFLGIKIKDKIKNKIKGNK